MIHHKACPMSQCLAWLVLVLVLVSLGAERSAAAAQDDFSQAYALVVGISDYLMGKDAGSSGKYSLPNLTYGSLDARTARDVLEATGVPTSQIRMLTDAEANKANIISGLEWLVQQSSHASRVIYYHSGHGTNALPDIDGDEALLEPGDHVDEALVPYDAVDLAQFSRDYIMKNPILIKDYQEKLLIDDELYGYIQQMQSPILLIIDACFSGGVSRGAQRNTRKAVDLVPKEIMDLLPKAGSAATGSAAPDALPTTATLLAASQESQPANEIINLGGVFTYWLGRVVLEPDDKYQADMLGNGDKLVTLKEAYDYVSGRVISSTGDPDDPSSIQEPFAVNLQQVAELVLARL